MLWVPIAYRSGVEEVLVMAESGYRHIISGWGLSQNDGNSSPDLDDAEDFQLSKAATIERFGPAISTDAIDEAIALRIPEKTKKTTEWVLSVFRSWCGARGVKDRVENLSTEEVARLLPNFVMEARRQDGTPYPPNTLVMLVAGIQRHLRENGQPELSIMSDKDGRFARTRAALDARMKSLTKDGVGTVRKQAEPLTPEQEDTLWSSGIFSLDSGWGLTYAVFWYNCKLFGLRGGDEHRQLQREQFEIGSDGVGRFVRFMGRSCKNVQGGLKQRKVQTKDLRIYARPDLEERCVVDMYNHYFAFIPMTGDFYRKPIGDNPPKYSKQVLGKNKLGTLVKEMCTRAGFTGNYTNHSGKVTCATQLFASNIDEQLIMRQTGHRSQAVRAYKRPGAEHEVAVSSVLQPPPSKKRLPLSESGMTRCASEPGPSVHLGSGVEESCKPSLEISKSSLLASCACEPGPSASFTPPAGIVLNFNFR